MTTIKDIFEYTESFAPISTAAEWDNCGLIVGDIDSMVSRVMLALDITDEVVKEAADCGCELIISHHPVIFDGLKSVDKDSVVYKLVKNDISALCLHTNLDLASDGGVNVCLADKLCLTDKKTFDGEYICIGKLKDKMSSVEFAEYVKQKLNCNGVRYTNGGDVSTVCVSSGAGGDSVELYKKYGFDALVTGEIKHHQLLFAKAHNLCVVDAGHFATEDVVITPLCNRLSSIFSDVQFIKSTALSDPVKFL